ncbi:hypothetical protein SEA_APIARY_7 [Rhodococcus phage Apiary]|nr:hypothetical protein SEA_BRAXOADDIE_7 [Rhodococcus phage Braxoaddie]WNM64930.1 hypothetical protein SEA_MASELOP_7 [Rhodococcus phage Maselop]WNM67391.1 hypothetical protein SEA_POLYYUKI_7 [Rhodococcus phage Polyyuki]WNM69815.1 hypothetical protein SEA_APIARY_7 [Rhodococcus phage Apiary]
MIDDQRRAENRAEWMEFRHHFLRSPDSARDWAESIHELAATRPPEPPEARMSKRQRDRLAASVRREERQKKAQAKRDRRAGLAR